MSGVEQKLHGRGATGLGELLMHDDLVSDPGFGQRESVTPQPIESCGGVIRSCDAGGMLPSSSSRWCVAACAPSAESTVTQSRDSARGRSTTTAGTPAASVATRPFRCCAAKG